MKVKDADVLLVDGKNTLWRAAYACLNLGFVNAGGTFVSTGGAYGFFESVLAVANKAPKARVIVCWEGSRRNRQAIVPSYKAHRDADENHKAMQELVARQEAVVKGILSQSAWDQARSPKWEADDTIATIAESCSRVEANCLILSNDADLQQCLRRGDPWTRIVRPTKSGLEVVTTETLLEEWGLEPWQVPHLKALGGDSSDGYSGIPGVGLKTAAEWLRTGRTIHGVLANAHAGEIKGKRAATLIEQFAAAEACLRVAETSKRVPVEWKRGEPDDRKLLDVLSGLRFHSLANKATVARMTAE